jgi:chemotaxis protein MotB
MEQMTTDEMKRNLDTGDRRLQKSDGAEQRSDSGKDDAERHRRDQSTEAEQQKSGDEQLVVMPRAEAEELLKARERAERRQRLEQTAEQMRAALEKELQGGQLEIETEDEKIVIRIREKASFASGGVEVRDSFRPVLVRVAQILQKTSGEIAVVGHTDNVPLEQGLFRSNWDLSAARAVSVLHAMLESVRLNPARFSVQGAGDTQPLVDNDTPAQRARNRRVEIILKQGEDLEAKTGIRSGLVPPEADAAARTPPPASETDAGTAPDAGTETPEAGQDPFVQPAG